MHPRYIATFVAETVSEFLQSKHDYSGHTAEGVANILSQAAVLRAEKQQLRDRVARLDSQISTLLNDELTAYVPAVHQLKRAT
jgi:polyhydroxyalkanoate synthesis regulator phasin